MGLLACCRPPVKPLIIGKETYILLDLGEDARQLQRPRTGAMGLYGSDYSVDYRVVTAFARRITVVDAAHCDCEAAPSGIIDLKTALTDPTLQYSGIYEDSWIGQGRLREAGGRQAGESRIQLHDPEGNRRGSWPSDALGRRRPERDAIIGAGDLHRPGAGRTRTAQDLMAFQRCRDPA